MAKHGWKGFGIHPHIAENQPHEVRTLGMNHPVCAQCLLNPVSII